MLPEFGSSEYWKNRKITDKIKDWRNNGDLNWIEEYWKSKEHPHRKLIIRELKKLQPFERLIEVGSNCGPNIFLINKEFPKIDIVGIDINRASLLKGISKFPKEFFRNSGLFHQNLEKEINFRSKDFDVILSDAVLMYISPEKIRQVIEEMIRVTKKAIILCEWQIPDNKLGEKVYGHWARDYVKLLGDYGIKTSIYKLTKEDWPSENWSRVGYIITGSL